MSCRVKDDAPRIPPVLPTHPADANDKASRKRHHTGQADVDESNDDQHSLIGPQGLASGQSLARSNSSNVSTVDSGTVRRQAARRGSVVDIDRGGSLTIDQMKSVGEEACSTCKIKRNKM